MLWQLKLSKLDQSVTALNMKDIRTVKTHVQYDSASLIRWSPDSKALVTVRQTDNHIEIYKVAKKPDGGKAQLPSVQPTHSFPKVNSLSIGRVTGRIDRHVVNCTQHRESDLLSCEVASTGRFIMTCTAKNELDLLDLKGNLLASITTNQMETYFARISPDGRFIASSGLPCWESSLKSFLTRTFFFKLLQASLLRYGFGRWFTLGQASSKRSPGPSS